MRLFILLLVFVFSVEAKKEMLSLLHTGEKVSAITKFIYEKEMKKPLAIASKGEFEPQATYTQRVSRAKALFNSSERQESIKKEALAVAVKLVFGTPYLSKLNYDTDSKKFVAHLHSTKKDLNRIIEIDVTLDEAKAFKEHSDKLNVNVEFSLYKDELFLENIDVAYNEKLYSGKSMIPLSLRLNPKIVPNTVDNKLALQHVVNKNSALFASQHSTGFTDDLTFLLSRAKPVDEDSNKWAIIIGIENYQFTDNIIYAARSAKTFEKIALKRLGVPKNQVFTLIDHDATLGNIKNKIRHISSMIKEGDTVFFYYNGHGIPVPSMKNEPFMLASDIEPDFVQDDTFFSLKNIYNRLSKTKATKIVAIVDSCFSGATDGKALLKGVAAARLQAKSVSFDKNKMAVLTAGKGTQYSNAFREKGHRLFSYFVMKNLIKGETSTYNLYKESYAQTKEESPKAHGTLRLQEPTLNGNAKIEF